jgi:outer membrane protein OmpA-like peptidoglycan-associated protein
VKPARQRTPLLLGVGGALAAVGAAALFCLLDPDHCGLVSPVPPPEPVIGGLYGGGADLDLEDLAQIGTDRAMSERLRHLLLAALGNARAEAAGNLASEARAGELKRAVTEVAVIANAEIRAMALAGIALTSIAQGDEAFAMRIARDQLTPATATTRSEAQAQVSEQTERVFGQLDPNADRLPSALVARLDGLIDRFLAEDGGTGGFEFHGRTWDSGDEEQDQARSLQFAQLVHDHLSSRGVPDTAISGWAAGSEQMIAPSDTEDGRRRNNRVELTMTIAGPARPYPGEAGPLPTDTNAKWRALVYKAVADGFGPEAFGFAFSPAITLTLGAVADAAATTGIAPARMIADVAHANPEMHWFGYMLTLVVGIGRYSPLELAEVAREMPMLDIGGQITAYLAYLGNQDKAPLERELAAARATALAMDPSPVQQHLLMMTASAGAWLAPETVPRLVDDIQSPVIRDWMLTAAAIRALQQREPDAAVAALRQLSGSGTRNLYLNLTAAAGLTFESWAADAEAPGTTLDLASSPTLAVLERAHGSAATDGLYATLALASLIPIHNLPGGPATIPRIRDPALRRSMQQIIELAEPIRRGEWDRARELLLAAPAQDQARLIGVAALLVAYPGVDPAAPLDAELIAALIAADTGPPSPNALAELLRALSGDSGLTHFLEDMENGALRDLLILSAVLPMLALGQVGIIDCEPPRCPSAEESVAMFEELARLAALIENTQLRDFLNVFLVPILALLDWSGQPDASPRQRIAQTTERLAQIEDPIFRDAAWQWLAVATARAVVDDGLDASASAELALLLLDEILSEPVRDATLGFIVPSLVAEAGPAQLAAARAGELIEARISDPMIKAVTLGELAIRASDDQAQFDHWFARAVETTENVAAELRDEALATLVILSAEAEQHQRGVEIAARIRDPRVRASGLVLMGGSVARAEAQRIIRDLPLRDQASVAYLIEIGYIPQDEFGEGPLRQELGDGRHVMLLPWTDTNE